MASCYSAQSEKPIASKFVASYLRAPNLKIEKKI